MDYRLPALDLRTYHRDWWRSDLFAGIAVAALLVPAGMGYAEVAGLPPVTGLYATVVPILVYALIGPSRILVLGPDSSMAPIIAAAIIPLAASNTERRVELAGVLAIEVGAILVLGGLLRLGFITSLLAKPIRIGYLNGIALIIVLGQLPKLLGYQGSGESLLGLLVEDIRGVVENAVQPKAAAIGLVCLVGILVVRYWRRSVPAVLAAVIGSTLLIWLTGWQQEVPVVGAMPEGLPRPTVPSTDPHDWAELLLPAAGIALIAFADTGLLSRTFNARAGEAVNGNWEVGAVGAANAAAGFTGGFPITVSSTRTAVAEQSGGRSRLTALIGGLLVLATLLLIPGVTAYLPSSALAAVVITAAMSLVDVRSVVKLFRIDPVEGVLSVVAFLGVAILGVLQGILVAVALAFVTFVYSVSRPYRTRLGRVPGVRGYHDMTRYPNARPIPDTVLLRFDAPLFFANSAIFNDWVREEVRAARAAGRSVKTVVLACEPITHIDSSAIDDLVDLDDYLTRHAVDLVFAELKDPVREQLERYRLRVSGFPRFGAGHFSPTVGAAVDEILDDEIPAEPSPTDQITAGPRPDPQNPDDRVS